MSLDEQQQVMCDLLNLTQQRQGEVKSVCASVCVKPPAAEKVRYIDFVPKRQTGTGRQMDYSGGAVSSGPYHVSPLKVEIKVLHLSVHVIYPPISHLFCLFL